jgi:hypothetical protein
MVRPGQQPRHEPHGRITIDRVMAGSFCKLIKATPHDACQSKDATLRRCGLGQPPNAMGPRR